MLTIIYVDKRKYTTIIKYIQLHATTITTIIVIIITNSKIVTNNNRVKSKQIYVNIHNMNLLLVILFSVLSTFKQLYV